MLIYSLRTDTCANATVLHFGSGLIGKAILDQITYWEHAPIDFETIQYDWGNLKLQFDSIWKEIGKKVNDLNAKELHIVWAAGKAGFSAKKEETEIELFHFKNVLFQLSLFFKSKNLNTYFHLMSSAGGIHEGLRLVRHPEQISLKRPYGHLKYAQEDLLKSTDFFSGIIIYRISSVYTFKNLKGRIGLITALVNNGIKNKVTGIFGAERTLRDYVLDMDIARCVFMHLKKIRKEGVSIEYLINGKPSSLNEIRLTVEKILGKKLYLQYSLQQSNAQDITFGANLKSNYFTASSLLINIKLLQEHLLKGNI